MLGVVTLRDYRAVNYNLLNNNDTGISLKINELSPMYVSVFILESGVFTAHFTTQKMVSSGVININYAPSTPFSLFVFTAPDGLENSSLGRTKWGIFFSRGISNGNIISMNGDKSSLRGNQLIVVPVGESGFDITYDSIGRSITEHGDLWLRLK